MGKEKSLKLLTQVELEIMNVVWTLGRCTVREIVDTLSKERPLAYTSVATMMKILEQKKILKSQKQDLVHIFVPVIERKEYEQTALNHLTENVFQGSSTSVVMRLLDDTKLTKEELQEIKKTLNERLKS